MTKALPLLLAVLSLGAAVVYAAQGDVRRAIYFGAATVLTLSVVL